LYLTHSRSVELGRTYLSLESCPHRHGCIQQNNELKNQLNQLRLQLRWGRRNLLCFLLYRRTPFLLFAVCILSVFFFLVISAPASIEDQARFLPYIVQRFAYELHSNYGNTNPKDSEANKCCGQKCIVARKSNS